MPLVNFIYSSRMGAILRHSVLRVLFVLVWLFSSIIWLFRLQGCLVSGVVIRKGVLRFFELFPSRIDEVNRTVIVSVRFKNDIVVKRSYRAYESVLWKRILTSPQILEGSSLFLLWSLPRQYSLWCAFNYPTKLRFIGVFFDTNPYLWKGQWQPTCRSYIVVD